MDEEKKYWMADVVLDFKGFSEKNKKFYKYFFLIVSFLLVCFIVLFYLNNQKNANLKEFTEISEAIVTDIFVRHVKVNDMDGTTVLNYTISYEFIHNKAKINGKQIIDRYFYDNYFDEKLEINDTINIQFNPQRPELNIIKKKF